MNYIFPSDQDRAENQQLNEACEYIEYLLEAQGEPSSGVPEGWKLVPVEPTERMIQAGRFEPLAGEADEDAPDDYRAVYKAMLAAARGENEALRADGMELAKMAGNESRKCDELRARVIETDRDIRTACAEIIEVEAEKVGVKQGLARKMCKIRLLSIAGRLRGFDTQAAELERQSVEGGE